jgi:hypothetical protein
MTGIHASTPFDRLRANGVTILVGDGGGYWANGVARPIVVSLSNHRRRANGVTVLVGSGSGGYRTNGGGRRFGKTGYLGPVAPHHGFFLFTVPSFNLLFSSQCFLTGWEVLRKNHLQRTPLKRVTTVYSTHLVLMNPSLKIVGMAGIIAPVGAVKDINKEGHFSYVSFQNGSDLPLKSIHPSTSSGRTDLDSVRTDYDSVLLHVLRKLFSFLSPVFLKELVAIPVFA